MDENEACDLIGRLPLRLLTSEIIPPAPNKFAIDFLPEFSGYSWIGYGASSLLVISHFPSPLSSDESFIGPILRQHFHLSAPVTSVSWSPVTPSRGDIAAAADNRISIFSHDSLLSPGSFCWSQTSVLVQATNLEAIKWTGSGDGIVAVGTEVFLWKKKNREWEIAWKWKMDQPQKLVSTTWSIAGPVATAAASLNEGNALSPFSEGGKCVSVCYGNGEDEYTKAELRHPQPVTMIQWRPVIERKPGIDVRKCRKDVLLTCCLDGTVRLWCEVDSGRVKKTSQDKNDQKIARQSFCVAAVIEVSQTLSGTLGTDVFVEWAAEVRGTNIFPEGENPCFSRENYQFDSANRCDWLIGVAHGKLITFWAVHCLDDISPMRFPRVTLWKNQEIQQSAAKELNGINMCSIGGSVLHKFFVSRNQLFTPPTVCSLIQILPCNSVVWSVLYTQTPETLEDGSFGLTKKEHFLSSQANGLLDIDGHSGLILKVAVHPDSFEDGLLASLDSNGWILVWSLSSVSNCRFGSLTLNSTWKLCGKLLTGKSCPAYTSLRWAPSVLDNDRVLLMGHNGGIDCYLAKFSQNEEGKLVFHQLCTIPCTGQCYNMDGPENIFAVPLPSTCPKTLNMKKFLLVGVWMKRFQVLSWEITLHSFDLSGSIRESSFDNADSLWSFDITFSGKRYCIGVRGSSSEMSDSHTDMKVTACAAICPVNLITTILEGWDLESYFLCNNSAYHLATGYSDGTVRLWRSITVKQSTSQSEWELIGILASDQGPITALALTSCGRKIASICMDTNTSSLSIWGSVQIIGSGTFLLEGTLSLDGRVIAVNWLDSGNGQFLLGVCTSNKVQVYAQRHCSAVRSPKFGNSQEMQMWCCFASAEVFPCIRDFLWMPGASPLIIQDKCFSIWESWFFVKNKTNHVTPNSEPIKDNILDLLGSKDERTVPAIFADIGVNELVTETDSWNCRSERPVAIDKRMDQSSRELYKEKDHETSNLGAMVGLCSLVEAAEELLQSPPVYHPNPLLMNIYLGNWKRVHLVVRCIVDYFTTDVCKRKRSSASSGIASLINLSEYLEGQSNATAPLPLKDQDFFTQFVYSSESDVSGTFISSLNSKVSGFDRPLDELHSLGAITNVEKIQILAIIDLTNELSSTASASAYGNLDEPGRRFWVAVRFQQLYFFRRFGKLASSEDLNIDSGFYAWGFHSDCQEKLFDSILPNDPSWNDMRAMGVGFWFTNATALRSKLEKLARFQYLKTKDPKACALLYIALNRVQVLAGLFKISKDEKDKPLVGFLSRNFKEEKNRAAALKNAYVLMGRHQLELAVAFFLLGGDTTSALSVCSKNLGDEQLALVICRLVEGHNGSLESHLVSKTILPSAIENGDYWLASLLEWALGNYSQSFLIMLDVGRQKFKNPNLAMSSSHVAFLDPSIGSYCLLLATRNSMKNSLGEYNAAILARWATLMMATALGRCGLPLEGLECLSISQTIPTVSDQGSSSAFDEETVPSVLKPSKCGSSNWLSNDVAYHLGSLAKFDLALKYLSKLMKQHPSWRENYINPSGASTCFEAFDHFQYDKLVETFGNKLYSGLEIFEQKFSSSSTHFIYMISVYLNNNRLLFLAYYILRGYISRQYSNNESRSNVSLVFYPDLSSLLWRATKETSVTVSRFIVASSMSCSFSEAKYSKSSSNIDVRSGWIGSLQCCMQVLMLSLLSQRNSLLISSTLGSKDLISGLLLILDIYESCIYFSYAWMLRNIKGITLVVQPFLLAHSRNRSSFKDSLENLKSLHYQVSELLLSNSSIADCIGDLEFPKFVQVEESGNTVLSIPSDESWQIMRACLWQQISSFTEKIPDLLLDNPEGVGSSRSLPNEPTTLESISAYSEFHSKNMTRQLNVVSSTLIKLLRITVEHSACYHANQLASLLWLKAEDGLHVETLTWFEKSRQSQSQGFHDQDILTLEILNGKNDFWIFSKLWCYGVNAKLIHEGFAQRRSGLLRYISQMSNKTWSDISNGLQDEHEAGTSWKNEGGNDGKSASSRAIPSSTGLFWSGPSFLTTRHRDTTLKKENIPFQDPKEIYKRSGELFEALCINSIDQRQAALASNKKGILFFHREHGLTFRDQPNYVWAEADWPQNGWAGSDSTPIPTCVSPGVSLGINKGKDLGLGGTTIGVGSSARPGRDLTGGGAFGVPGYAGMGASGLGWEIQEDFGNFVDAPATVENIHTRAFSSHPSRPFFLVGSSNTHIYLWEFGKDKATATYGVLPVANVPPPYARASISALEFDVCGHRFASAALDGTVCTWQLEVGGRSNIHPTESCLCFNNYAWDVTYVTTSGSIIAAAGCGTDGVNVVIWDTLAPTSTARASIKCHEGGARSISVFDNDIGSGSISPLILTAGKAGDVGLHDFRYIATGKTKRHKHFDSVDQNSITSSRTSSVTPTPDTSGEQNVNGMLWYIPQAHLGSVTKISTIPNTSLFLTGSKDGDVKLWDAKTAKLVFHWSKLHERRTYLQPSTRAFGGVVQAAVTDIQVIQEGFLSCGGDGSVKMVELKALRPEK